VYGLGYCQYGDEHSGSLNCCEYLDQLKVKVKLSLYRPWRPLGLREVEASTFSDIRLTDGGKVVSPTRRPLFIPMKKVPCTHFGWRLSRPQGHSAAGRFR
jgi:hypothetical protein